MDTGIVSLEMKYFLVDNGSLRAESVLNLRRVARELSAVTGMEILPASVLHSSKVPAEKLEGEEAVNLERRIRLSLESGEDREFTILPFFFGPTGAITDYLPERLAYRRQKHGDFTVWQAPFLGDQARDLKGHKGRKPAGDLVEILAERVRETIREQQLIRPRVALVDHGSPKREVTALRDGMSVALREQLGDAVVEVAASSMERRDGKEYDFNEPLLERLLDQPGWDSGDVVVSMMFLSPGRHAGPGGDVDSICKAAEARHAGLRTYMTGLVGDHADIVPLLKRRLEEKGIAL
jgi:sirohydrochlorin ferrochelatase